ncbi:hypothetical protein C8A03DRAFT_39443 [Achaetomium macrosporum]|uniref:Uncharacterized protein n=1 Tax=Achaetomium macrosporum TaxID=79813 RepID=A0AAN7C153_9PEZI|nr:hypothetical protein C8A03DRAFT_39443 [Achaetomium macrosporum]
MAAEVLTALDQPNSTAATVGDLPAWWPRRASSSLDTTIVADRCAQAQGWTYLALQHIDPVFAIPAASAACFLAVATLPTTSDYVTRIHADEYSCLPPMGCPSARDLKIIELDCIRAQPAHPGRRPVDEAQRVRAHLE